MLGIWDGRIKSLNLPYHLGSATASSSDDGAPAPAPTASGMPPPAAEIDFMKWDVNVVTEMNSIPWDQLSFSWTGSKTMKH
jgi:hypothetical protein